jgi:hypothetical protein
MERSPYVITVNARLAMLYVDRNQATWAPTKSAFDRKVDAERRNQIARLEALQAAGKGNEPS